MNEKSAREHFFGMLTRGGAGLIELRAVNLKTKNAAARVFVAVDAHAAIDSFCRRHADMEIYAGVVPRISASGGGGASNCAPANCLWVDIDFKDKPRAAAMADLELYSDAPTMIVESGNGLHVYWALSRPLAGRDAVERETRRIADELGGDRRSADLAHVLRVPGTLNHKYDPPRPVRVVAHDPDAVVSMSVADPLHDDLSDISDDDRCGPASAAALARAAAIMEEWPPAVEGSNGDDHTYRVACMLARDFGLDAGQALGLMAKWNRRCVPPWSLEELAKKIRGAMAYGRGAIGADDPAREFAEVAGMDDRIEGGDRESALDVLSRVFKVVDDGGRERIYRSMWDPKLKRHRWIQYHRVDFLNLCKSRLQLPQVHVGEKANGDPRYMPAGEYWLDHHRGKLTYSGAALMPECDDDRTPDGMLNLWRGFAVEERADASWGMLKALAFETLCDWDAASWDYVMRWMARAVQRPWEPAGTALVFKGKKGAGKGTLGRAFARLFGQHGMHIQGRDQLTGRFNAHLRECVALFADEAFWAGDKSGESMLKAFITEPALTFEAKGKDPSMDRNCLHVMMASNSDWVVPAGMDRERRFAVFEAADDRRSRDWWNAMHAQMENGGLGAMLHELRRVDLSGFDVFDVPRTAALAEQKGYTMEPIAAWLLETAENGWEDFEHGHVGGQMYRVSAVYDSFLRTCRERDIRSLKSHQTSFGMTLKKYVPHPPFERKKVRVGEGFAYVYHLPEAEKCVEHIKMLLGLTE